MTIEQALCTQREVVLPGGVRVTLRAVRLREWAAMRAAYAEMLVALATARGHEPSDAEVATHVPEVLLALLPVGGIAPVWSFLRWFCALTPEALAALDAEALGDLWAAIYADNRRLLRLSARAEAAGQPGADHERDFLALLHRAGIDPRDPALTVQYALAIADAHAAHERRQAYQAAYLHAVAVSAGTHGHKDAWQMLEDGLRDAPADTPDAHELAHLFNTSPAEIEAALAKGWRPPRIRVQ